MAERNIPFFAINLLENNLAAYHEIFGKFTDQEEEIAYERGTVLG
jgi:hypothetical protein